MRATSCMILTESDKLYNAQWERLAVWYSQRATSCIMLNESNYSRLMHNEGHKLSGAQWEWLAVWQSMKVTSCMMLNGNNQLYDSDKPLEVAISDPQWERWIYRWDKPAESQWEWQAKGVISKNDLTDIVSGERKPLAASAHSLRDASPGTFVLQIDTMIIDYCHLGTVNVVMKAMKHYQTLGSWRPKEKDEGKKKSFTSGSA